jgi:hypothetical protein
VCLIKIEARAEDLERREHFRYGVWATVRFAWSDGDGTLHFGEGVTRDISSKGIFVCCSPSNSLPPGKADVEITIIFPMFGESGKHLKLEADAVVIRVELSAEPRPTRGFAVLNRTYRLKQSDKVSNA